MGIEAGRNSFGFRISQLEARMNDTVQSIALAPTANVYTIDLFRYRNFIIDNTTVDAKTITFDNIPTATDIVTNFCIELTMTEAATFTFTQITDSAWWQDSYVPTFELNKKYILWFETMDGGATWKCGAVGDFELNKKYIFCVNRITIFKSMAPIFGAKWDKSDTSDLTRTNFATGMIANAGVDNEVVRNDFDNAPIWGQMQKVTDALGNEFIRIPVHWVRKRDESNLKTWQVSRKPFIGSYLPWCFWDFTNNRVLPYVDVGCYNASLSADNKLESKPNTYPLIGKTIVNFRDYAMANGAGYQQLDIHVVDMLRTLFFIEFATIDSQSVVSGWAGGRYVATDLATVTESGVNRIIVANATASYYAVGQPISIGTSQGGNQIFYGRTITSIEIYDADNKAIYFDGTPVNIAVGNFLYNTGWKSGFSVNITASSGSIGSNSNTKFPCSYRGIENPFGNVWQWIDGINITDRQSWICKNAASYASNVFASPYEQLGYVNSNANGYAVNTGYDKSFPFAEIAVEVSGSFIRYKDYYYQDVGQRVALFGGRWNGGSYAGLSCLALDFSSASPHVSIGGRLIKKPL
jgi:hypothetical protein